MFDIYLALGDSMSIDFYPAQDAQGAGVSVNEEIGAASLFYRNDSNLFPEFIGEDLTTLFPGITYLNRAFDGATCEDLLSSVRMSDIDIARGACALVTITLGGNDLMNACRRNAGSDQMTLAQEYKVCCERYLRVIKVIREKLPPKSVLMLTSVFDPTDGTGILPIATAMYDMKLPIEFLKQFNFDCVEKIASDIFLPRSKSILFADVYTHFQGHGANCGSSENFWYWKPSPIEPSYRGASEIRRVWLATLRDFISNCSVSK